MKPYAALWGSVSALAGAVLAVYAFVPASWRTRVFLVVFAVWGLWILVVLVLPHVRKRYRLYRDRSRILYSGAYSSGPRDSSGEIDPQVESVLVRQVNYRISAYLRSVYPDAKWEWKTGSPARLIVCGGVGRIQLHGVPDYNYAEVTLDPKGSIRCDLLRLDPLFPTGHAEEAECADGKDTEPVNPRLWFEQQGRAVLESVIPDLISRGYTSLTMNEDGSIEVEDEQDGKAAQAFSSFPKRVYWKELIRVLESAGYAAAVDGDAITMTW